MVEDFTHATLPSGKRVFRLGLSASYLPGKRTVRAAIDEGVNYFFCYGFDFQMTGVLRELTARERDGVVIATGHGRNGVLLSPLAGEMVADLVEARVAA